jgi:ketosteroid isomerase-like protein
MEHMRPFLLCCAVLLVACSTVGPPSSQSRAADEEAVLRAEHEWVNVTLKGDVDAFSSFLADDYVALLTGARIRDKASWVSGLKVGTTTYQSVELSNLRVHLYGDTAVVFGDYTQKGTSGGKDNTAGGKYINTWIKRNGRWQVVASGFSRIPPQ